VTRHEVLLQLRHQFPILQREFLASAPEVCFFAFVRTNVIRELTQAEAGGNVAEVCSLVVSLLPTLCRIRFFVNSMPKTAQ